MIALPVSWRGFRALAFGVALMIGIPSLSWADEEIVVVTGARSTVTSVSNEVLAALFLGRTGKHGNLTLVAADHKDGESRAMFHQKVTGKSLEVLKRYWARRVFSGEGTPLVELANDAEVKAWLAQNPNGVSYIHAKSVDSSVKVLSRLR